MKKELIFEDSKNTLDQEMKEVSIEEIVELIKQGNRCEIIYVSNPRPIPNIITLVCEGVYCSDVREVKPVLTVHGRSDIFIRSQDHTDRIVSWKEFYIEGPEIYMSFVLPSEEKETEE